MYKIKINSIKICGRISTKFGCTMTHTFEFTAENSNEFEFEFSLPDGTVITNFGIKSDNEYYKARMIDIASDLCGGFKISQSSDGRCRVKYSGVSDGVDTAVSYILEVSSVVMMSLGAEFAEVVLPLVTEGDKKVRGKHERKNTSCVDSSVSVDFVIDSEFVSRISSPTHYAEVRNCDDGLHIHADAVTRGDFVLRLDYNSLKHPGCFDNTAYLTGGSGRDWTGVYLFSVPGSEYAAKDVLYILDSDGLKNRSGLIAAECLYELVEKYVENFGCMIAMIDGQTFCDELLNKSEIDLRELRKWINNIEAFAANSANMNIKHVIDEFNCRSRSPVREAVLVTCSGRAFDCCDAEADGLHINVLSVSENCFERELQKLADDSGGFYARMSRNCDYTGFVDGFAKRLSSGFLNNLKILEYALGTYFNLPNKIRSYRFGDIIAYTFRSATDYPEQLFLEADGGFSDIVRFDKINILPDSEESNAVFAQKVFSELYGYIARGDIAPESVAEFKAQAVNLSRELNVLCPETAYYSELSDDVVNIKVRSSSSDIIIRLGSKPVSGYAAVFGDDTVLVPELRKEVVYFCVHALLVCMRADFRFTSPYQSQNADMETMYAAAAIYRAADCGYLPESAAYRTIADKAVEAAGGKKRFDSTIIAFGGREDLALSDVRTILDRNDVIEISRFVLRLCRDGNRFC